MKMLSHQEMNQLGDIIKSALPDDGSFFLFIGKAGNTKTSGYDAQYMSSMHRVCALNCMQEFLIKNGYEDDWIKNLDFGE